MPDKNGYFKRSAGIRIEELRKQIPTTEDIIRQSLTTTDYELRSISPKLFFTEEQRPNIHVIGSSRQGKSRFLEWLMRVDIDRGIGCCLLDPTAGGETAKRMLAYCCEKGISKVLYIDLEDAFSPRKKILGLQPFKYKDGQGYPRLRHRSITVLMETIRSLYGVKDPSSQSFIERYLPAVFAVLYDNKLPLSHAQVFSNRLYRDTQKELLANTDSTSRMELAEAFVSIDTHRNIQSTVNRLIRFYRDRIGMMFSVPSGVDWMKVVRENWVVIARLDNIDFFDARLLGTYIITEIDKAKERLNELCDEKALLSKQGHYPPYYLYADEAYLFASLALKQMLDLKQKMNFKLTLAHHTASQFTDPAVYDSIKTNCGMKVGFFINSREDRDEMAREIYTGPLSELASDGNANIEKQHAVFKIGKDAPVRERIPDVPTPNVTPEELKDYLSSLYRHPWYYDADKITPPNYEPRRETKPHPKPPQPGAPAASKAGGKGRVPDAENYTRKFKTLSVNLPVGKQHAAEDGPAEGD